MNSLKRVHEVDEMPSHCSSSSTTPFSTESLSNKRVKIATPAIHSGLVRSTSSQSKRLLYSGSRVVKLAIQEDAESPDPALRLDEADLIASRRDRPRSCLTATRPPVGSFIPCSSLNETDKTEDIFNDSFTNYDFPFTQIENLAEVGLPDSEEIIEKSPERRKTKKRALNCKRNIFQQSASNVADAVESLDRADAPNQDAASRETVLSVERSSELNGALQNINGLFATASNKSISLSERAKNRALSLFEDINQEMKEASCLAQPNAPSGSNSLFLTASMKAVHVSEEAKQRAQKMFDEVNKSMNLSGESQVENNVPLTESLKPDDKMRFADISSGKLAEGDGKAEEFSDVKVDDLEKTVNSLEELVETSEPKSCASNLFLTASHKSVQISDKAKHRALALFKEVDDSTNPGEHAVEQPEPTLAIPSTVVFSTASHKKIEISDAARNRALKLFEEVGEPSSSGVGSMFSTASNKTVQISELAQKRALAMFEDVSESMISDSEVSKKSIELGVKPLQSARSGEVNQSRNGVTVTVSSKIQVNIGALFSTAGNKSIQISEAAQQRAMKLFEEVTGAGEDPSSFSLNKSKQFSEETRDELEKGETSPEAFKNHSESRNLASFRGHASIQENDSSQKSAEEANASSKAVPLSTDLQEPDRSLESPIERRPITDRELAAFQSSPSIFHDRPFLKPLIASDEGSFSVDDVEPQDPPTSGKRKISAIVESATKKVKTKDETELRNRRETLRRFQRDMIRCKKKGSVRLCPGVLTARKSEGPRIKLQDALIASETGCEVSDDVAFMTPSSAESFKFQGKYYFSDDQTAADSIYLIDHFHLILDAFDAAGLDEISSSFLASPHVDPSLVPDDWIRNHYKWIVWKLACYDRLFSHCFPSRCLTPDNVLLQLKYRFDREIDLGKRSCFRMILEGDQPPSRKFVCCVSSIRRTQMDESGSSLEIELCDGWYSLWAVIDSEMSLLLKKGVVRVGTKLLTQGASLLNWEGGCSPLQTPLSVKLKISTNSVRRVKWFAKMGFTRCHRAIPTTLKHALPNGGSLGVFTAAIVRVYPILHMSKDADGKTVFRNERCALLIQARQQQKETDRAEKLFEEILREVEKEYRLSPDELKRYSREELVNCSQPEVLWSALEADNDSYYLQSLLKPEQLKMVANYKEKITFKIKEDVERIMKERIKDELPPLKVSKLLKVRVVGACNTQAVLSIWNPSVEMTEALVEEKTYDFYNFNANGKRDCVLQLSATKTSVFHENLNGKPHGSVYSRSVTKLEAFKCPDPVIQFGEVDIVGLVVTVQYPDVDNGVTKVFLTDLNDNIVVIAFWTSLKAFGYDDLLVEKVLVAACNLQWRQGSGMWKVPCLYATETSTFSLNPKQGHFSAEMNYFREQLRAKGMNAVLESSRETIERLCSRPRSSWPRGGSEGAGRNSPRHPSLFVSSITPRHLGSSAIRHTTPRPLAPRQSNNNATPRTPLEQRVKALSRLGSAPSLSPWPVRLCKSEFKSPMSEN